MTSTCVITEMPAMKGNKMNASAKKKQRQLSAEIRSLWPQRELLRDFGRIDSLANHYGRLYHSSTTSEFLLTIVAAFFSALAFILFPFIAGISVVTQVLVNGLVLLDSMTRTTQRWQERWLD